MKKYFFLFLFSLISTLNIKNYISNEEFFPKIKQTLLLTDLTIERAILNNEKITIIFFAPWCEYCKNFLPLFQKFSESKDIKKYNMTLGQINIDYYIKTRDQFNINYYPTIIFFNNFGKEKLIYNSQLTYEGLNEFFYRNLINPFHFLFNLNQSKEIENKEGINFIYFGKDENDIKTLINRSLKDYSHNYYLTNEKKLYKEYNILKERTLLLIKEYDEKFDYLIENNITENNINSLIKLNEFPYILSVIDALDQMSYFQESIVFVVKNNIIKDFNDFIYKQAKIYRGRLRFCFLNEENDFKLIEFINYTNLSNVKISIIDFKQGDINNISFNETFSYEKIIIFFDNYLKGYYKLPLKSEKIPINNNKTIFKLVKDNFINEVINNKKDIFVKFYSPYCGHCIKLSPLYEELGKKFEKINNYIKIAEFNIAENDFDYFQIKGYPTLIFWNGNNKKIYYEYAGDRSVNDMINFIIKYSSFYLENDGNFVKLINESRRNFTEEKI